MIPKIIHYCWFGRNPLPPLATKCIASWKKYLPDYEIKEWNEDNFDVNIIPYTKEAYEAKKYAFVSDYARFWIIYHFGGLYFDTDVEVIKSFNKIVKYEAFMGAENKIKSPKDKIIIAAGLGIGAPQNHPIYREILQFYQSIHFIDSTGHINYKTVCNIVTEIFEKKGLLQTNEIQTIEGITIFPSEYFNPTDFITRKVHIKKNTHSIHWYMASWKTKTIKIRIKEYIQSILPEFILNRYHQTKK